MLLTKPFQDARYILDTIEEAGHQAYFVGGCVRDLFLNRPIGDIDITTSAKPDVIQEIFDEVIPVGIEHGTVIVRHNQVSYEVTTYRVEGAYSDQRHPDSVEFIDNIDRDLERRDFTINALAMDKAGNVRDLFDGLEDLNKRVIRTVGNGFDRFKEDPLRILRAIRFSSQLGFRIEEATQKAIMAVKPEIEGLAVERITKEMEKLFAGDAVATGLNYLFKMGVDQHLPVLNEHNIFEPILNQVKPLKSLAEVICLFHTLEPNLSIRYVITTWKCSNKTLKEAIQLSGALSYYRDNGFDNWLAYILLPDLHNGFTCLLEILFPTNVEKDNLSILKHSLAIQSKRELAVNGNDIVGLFPNRTKGPWIQELLQKLEFHVVQGHLRNEKSILKDWIKWNPPEIN